LKTRQNLEYEKTRVYAQKHRLEILFKGIPSLETSRTGQAGCGEGGALPADGEG